MSRFQCGVCAQGPQQGVSVYRTNPKGPKGIWRCEFHLPEGNRPQADVAEIVATLEAAQRTKQ